MSCYHQTTKKLSEGEFESTEVHRFHAPVYHIYRYPMGVLVTLDDGCRYLVEPYSKPRQVFLATEDAYA